MLLNTLFWSINRICRTHHCSVCFLHLALCLLHIKIRTLSQTMWNKRLILVWGIFDKENTSAIFYRTYITKHNSWILHFSRIPWRLPWCLNLSLYLIGDFSCIAFWSSIHCSVQLMAEWFRKNSFWLFFAFFFYWDCYDLRGHFLPTGNFYLLLLHLILEHLWLRWEQDHSVQDALLCLLS